MKSVSVIIISYHTGPILFESISSALRQSETRQLIVVNNGNPDWVVDTMNREFDSDERFLLINGHGNIGFSKACNLAAKNAIGNLLLLLNPDCIISENGIRNLVHVAGSFTGKWLLAPHLVNPDQTEQQGGRREILTPWIAFVEGVKLYKLLPNHPYFKRFVHHDQTLPTEVSEVPVTSGACMLLNTSAYRDLGGMDEGYFLHVEDIDFCLRFRKTGGKIYFCPQVTFVHALGTSEASRLFLEWHKLIGFRRYFHVHFQKIYPPGFICMVNCLIAIRFGIISVKEIFYSIIRPWRHRYNMIKTLKYSISHISVYFHKMQSARKKNH